MAKNERDPREQARYDVDSYMRGRGATLGTWVVVALVVGIVWYVVQTGF